MTPAQRSVLLVEDEPDHRALLDACLQRADGYRVVGHAETGEDAEALAEKFQPDIVLLDLQLTILLGNGLDTGADGDGAADDDRGHLGET